MELEAAASEALSFPKEYKTAAWQNPTFLGEYKKMLLAAAC